MKPSKKGDNNSLGLNSNNLAL